MDANASATGNTTRAVGLLQAHLAAEKAKPIPRGEPAPAPESTARGALSFLDAFGYLGQELAQWKDITLDDILNAIGDFQERFGLKKTKSLNLQTVRVMQLPRCGCPDNPKPHHRGYVDLQAKARAMLPAWQKRGLTYYIQEFIPGLDQTAFATTVQQAFDAWAQYGNIAVRRTTTAGETPDIVLSTGRGSAYQFDGPSGTLAWAYLPNGLDGQLLCRFDLDERWLLPGMAGPGIKLLHVATHEFGHLYGLDHSKVNTALMAPYYSDSIGTPQTNDDIPRFQARYGAKTPTTPASPPASPPTAPAPAGVAITTAGNVAVTVNGKKVI